MTKQKSHHIVRNPDGGWSVKRGGASKASGTYKTQADAIKSGRQISKSQGSDLVIHGKNGRIQGVTTSRRGTPAKGKRS